MRRVLALTLVVAAGLTVALVGTASGGDERRYTVVLDNAFGLIEGADLKAAGVRIGSIESLDIDRRTFRAAVEVVVEKPEFGRFREDVFCRVEPQSLIGEYFLNCEPGTSPQELESGATIPVEQTATTVPPDLVQNILRRPYRERLGLLLTEFGAGFGARGPDVNAAIRRAVPALREVDRVLKVLADNRREIRSLTREADTVIGALAGNRDDVARFVAEARDTAQASAERRRDLAQTIDLFPTFLREFRPVLRSLQTVAEEQTPALRDLRAAAPDLETLFRRLGPFAEASRPAIRSLGDASDIGVRAMREAEDTVEKVRRLARTAKDPVTNLRYVLEHIDDRRWAVEKSPVSPTGQGFTGLEAFLRYFFVQSQAINIFDARGYSLKLNALINECTQYANAETAKEKQESCGAALGPEPYGPGGTEPQTGEESGATATAAGARGTTAKRTSGSSSGSGGSSSGGSGSGSSGGDAGRLSIPGVGSLDLSSLSETTAPVPSRDPAGTQGALLDFLLAP